MTDRELMQQALEALEDYEPNDAHKVSAALRERLARQEHITDGSKCWCDPELDYKDPETGAEVWVHRSTQ